MRRTTALNKTEITKESDLWTCLVVSGSKWLWWLGWRIGLQAAHNPVGWLFLSQVA